MKKLERNLHNMSNNLAHNNENFITYFNKDGQIVKKYFHEVYDDIEKLKAELSEAGVSENSVVGLIGKNCYEWIIADLALLSLSCISVCFTESGIENTPISELIKEYKLNAFLFANKTSAKFNHPCVAVLDERPVKLTPVSHTTPDFEDGIFSLVFSSGTTGIPKCLMMNRPGIENTVMLSGKYWQVTKSDNILIALPFSNFQQRVMVYIAIWFGFNISLTTPERLYPAVKIMSPSIIIGPPSFYEIVENQYYSIPSIKRLFIKLYLHLASIFKPSRIKIIKKRFFTNIYGFFTDDTRLLLVGSAPSRSSMLKIYRLLDIPLYQVYGITEFGWVSFNLPSNNKIGSVGKICEGVTVEIAEDGEILVKSDTLQTKNYRNDNTADQGGVFLGNGWFATGDIGDIDGDGFLFIKGRKKNIIITKGGYKLNPEYIEAMIENIPNVSRTVIFGGGQLTILVCLVWIEDLLNEEELQEIKYSIEKINAKLPASEKIGRTMFRSFSELNEQDGTLTRNHKINRNVVFRKYRDIILQDHI